MSARIKEDLVSESLFRAVAAKRPPKGLIHPGASVKVTLEIEADIPNRVPDNAVRTGTENSRTLKFTDQDLRRSSFINIQRPSCGFFAEDSGKLRTRYFPGSERSTLQMNVILKEDVKNLGKMGEFVSVKEGYARNFLLPRGLAVEANDKNVKEFEHTKRQIIERAGKIKTDAETIAARVSGKTVTIAAKAGEEDKLFGSVTAMDIAEALKKDGIEVDRKKIHLDDAIRRLGTYTVSIKVHPEVSAELNIQVVAE